MANVFLQAPPPDHLEDEALMIETAGEMPEVALAESLHHLGALPPDQLRALRAATARAYLKLIVRDLDYASVGQGLFRGLERALANLQRLTTFLASINEQLSPGDMHFLNSMLEDYLAREAAALAAGRPYASARPEVVEALARALGLERGRIVRALAAMAALPAPDCRALAALARLERAGGARKRRHQGPEDLTIGVEDDQGQTLAQVVLTLIGPSGAEDPELRRRAEDVWRCLALPVVD